MHIATALWFERFVRHLLVALLLTACVTPEQGHRAVPSKDPSNPEAAAGVMPLARPLPAQNTAELFTCPMHADVHGAKGSSCPQCGMALTVPQATP